MKRLAFAISALFFALLACNLPSAQEQEATSTAAAQTLAAQLTSVAQTLAAPTSTSAPSQSAATSTSTPLPSNTPIPATNTPLPCNLAAFISDVTYPDDTPVLVGQTFTKTWRFKNIGTCTWTSNYQLVFDHENQMGGPISQALTSGTVPPGATVDISVNLTAPVTPGQYRGYWRFRDPAGVLFGLNTGSFWVQIQAVQPTATPTITPTITITPTPTITLTTAALFAAVDKSVTLR